MQNQTVKLVIDSQPIEVAYGSTILEAAKRLGIEIPTLCLPPDGTKAAKKHRPSCMVCVVEVVGRGGLVPACSALAEDGMEVITDSELAIESRRNSVEMLLSEHLGECEAPCQLACPVGWNVPEFMKLLAGDHQNINSDAIEMITNQLPLAGLLGKLCHSPCQSACRIKQTGGDTVQIQKLHYYAATKREKISAETKSNKNCRIAIIGSGPAGLAAASTVRALGGACCVFEKTSNIGGTLLTAIDSGDCEAELLQAEITLLKQSGTAFECGKAIDITSDHKKLLKDFDAVIIATGSEADLSNLQSDKIFTAGKSSPAMAKQSRLVHMVASGKKATQLAVAAAKNLPKPQFSKINLRYGQLTDEESQAIFGRIDKYATFGELSADAGKISAEAARCLQCGCRSFDDCRLRNIATLVGAKTNRFTGSRRAVEIDRSHPVVTLEAHKCILCGACGAESAATAASADEKSKLAVIGRGIHCNISSVCGKLADQCPGDQAIKLADICPTAAIHKR